MNLFLLFISSLVLVNGKPASWRHARDVSHLDLSYLPPSLSQLKEYLPPSIVKQLAASNQLSSSSSPPQEYLTPVAAVKDLLRVTEKPYTSTSAADLSETEETTATLPPANQYLPPVAAAKAVTDKPTNEYLPPVHTGEDISEIPLEALSENNGNNEIATKTSNQALFKESSGEVIEALSVAPPGTAINNAEGYHYNKPDIIPDLFTQDAKDVKAEYLPPLANGVTAGDAPANRESAVLESNGHH